MAWASSGNRSADFQSLAASGKQTEKPSVADLLFRTEHADMIDDCFYVIFLLRITNLLFWGRKKRSGAWLSLSSALPGLQSVKNFLCKNKAMSLAGERDRGTDLLNPGLSRNLQG